MSDDLLKETVECLKAHDKTPNDVLWVGGDDFYFEWNIFANLAAGLEYDSGFGAQHIAKDLMVVGRDFWLERGEYDGSESWKFKSTPVRPKKKLNPVSLGGDHIMWERLSEIEATAQAQQASTKKCGD